MRMSLISPTVAAFLTVAALAPAQAASLEEARQAYQERRFDEVQALLAPALADPAQEAQALLLLGRTQVYQGKLDQARQTIRAAQAKGLDGEAATQADLALQYISESLAENAAIPKGVTYQSTAYLRVEAVDGIARDATISPILAPRRETDGRVRGGAAFGVDMPVASDTQLGLGVGLDEVRYRTFIDYNEANLRGSARLLHRFSDVVAGTLSYDAQLTTIADHDQYAMIQRLGAGTSFRQHRAADGAYSLVGHVAYDVSFAEYRTAHALDSTTHAVTLTEQMRFRDPLSWIAPSVTFALSDAQQSQFSYAMTRLMLAGQSPLSGLGVTQDGWSNLLVRGSVSRSWLDFRGRDTVETDRARYDTQDSIGVGLTKPLSNWAQVVLDASATDVTSTLSRQEYRSWMLSGGLHLAF